MLILFLSIGRNQLLWLSKSSFPGRASEDDAALSSLC